MLNKYRLKTKFFFKFGYIIPGILLFSNANADVDITFESSLTAPLVINVGESVRMQFDARFSDANFREIFLHIPDKPDFFTFWSEKRFTGPTDFIYDNIIFKPTEADGGQYFFQVVAGGIRQDGTIESDTLEYELRVKPFIFAEPEFSGGTTNTIAWMKSDSVYDQWIYLTDPLNPGVDISGDQPGGFAKTALSGEVNTTFENLQHDVRYGFFIKGFTAEGIVTLSDTVYSIQDSDLPEFLDSSYGHEAPARSVELWWQAVTDPTSYVTGYVIFRRKDLEPYIAIDTVFVDGNQQNGFFYYLDSPGDLVEGVKYFYKISGLDAGYNVGDGLEVGPLIPDATPPGLPVFHWDLGLGFDYVLDFPVDGLPEMGYNEKTWYKKGTQNSVYVFNPENQPGFENLAKADSVRFQAVRDSSKFFEDEWQPGMQFFEKWFSPWLSIEDFAGQDVFYNFDFTDNGKNDNWFVHGHFYKFRAQYKDIAGNQGGWSRVNPDGHLVGEFQDLFAPNDISNLNIFVQFDPSFAGGGYFRVEWELSEDPVSGVAKYNVYRKIGESGTFIKISSITATNAVNYQYLDPFANIGQRKKTFYRITSVDNVGNTRSVNDTEWEVYEWPPLPPEIVLEKTYLTYNNRFYTKETSAGIHWPDFDVTDVAEMYVYNNSDSQKIDLTSPRFDQVLNEGENNITARVLFANGLWSPKSNILMVNKDSTPPLAITGLTVANDPSFSGNIFLNWPASTDQLPVVYEVFRKNKGSNDYKSLTVINSTSWTDPYSQSGGSVLKAFQHYEYKVLPKDTLNNISEQNAGFGETYCNIAPVINKLAIYQDNLMVGYDFPAFSDSNAVELNLISFEVLLFQDNLPQQVSSNTAYRSGLITGEKQLSLNIESGRKYYVLVRAVEKKSSNSDSSAWSEPNLTRIMKLTVNNDEFFTGNMFLSWLAPSDPALFEYQIYRRDKGTPDFSLIGETKETTWIDLYNQPGGGVLKAFQYYDYKVVLKELTNSSSALNEAFDENYCNIAPVINRFSFTTDSMKIFWKFPSVPDSSSVPLESLRFDVKLFQGALPPDFPTAAAYQVDYIIGDKSFEFKIEPGPKYFAVVRALELVSSNVDSSAWSKSKFSDTGESVIPTVDLLMTQAQPLDNSGIFVSWESYWNDPFWTANNKNMLGRVDVLRWKKGDPQNVFERSFKPASVEFENSGFMDKDSLEPDVTYIYQVIPFEIKVNDPPRFLPAGNADMSVLNDTSEVINYIDRVFIPQLNHLYAENPNTGKKYFTLLNPDDSLRIEWFWLYEKNNEKVLASAGDFRGAQNIRLFVSNNPDFVNQPDFKRFTQIIEINRADLTNDELFYFTYISDISNPNTFNIYEGKSLFLKIAAFDRWGNSPAYPSSQEIDGFTEMILDNMEPSGTTLSFQVKSSVDTTSDLTLVNIIFNWLPATDNISGVRDYSIIVNSKDNPDSIILNISEIPPQATTITYFDFEIKDEYFEFPLNFNIFPRDYAGNINRDTPPVEFKFFNAPDIISVNRDPLTNKLDFKWTKVQGADKYLVVFAIQKSYFTDEGLRDNPGNNETIVAQTSDPDTLTKILSKFFNASSSWYFRITAINSDVFESGWSNFYLLEPASSPGGEDNPISIVEGDLDIPSTYRLYQNYPNPFNPETTIEYDVPVPGEISVSIFNLKGEKVRTLISGEHQPGNYFVKWQGLNDNNELVASGMYLYIITAPNYRQVEKCLFLK